MCSQEEKEHCTYKKKRKDIWISHILRRNYLLQHQDRGKDKSDGETGKEPDGVKENGRCWKLNEGALDRTLGITRFGPAVRKTTE